MRGVGRSRRIAAVAAVGLGSVGLASALSACGGSADQADGVATATVTATVTAEITSGSQPASPSAEAGATSSSAPTPSTDVSASDPTRPPTTYAEAVSQIDALAEPQGDAIPTFITPSGNIFCSTGGVTAGCEISEGGVDDPSACPDNPMTTVVGRLEVRDGRVEPVCNTDTIRVSGARTLSYGSVVGGSVLQCVSEQFGVSCVDRDDHVGFFLARGRYLVLR